MENILNFWSESVSPSLTSIDSLLTAQDFNFSCNQLTNTVPNLLTYPDIFVDSENPNPQDQAVNEYVDLNSGVVISSDEAKETENDESSNTLYKGHWRKNEDCKLRRLVKQRGDKNWAEIAKEMPRRNGKQCRELWQNHLRPDIKKKLIWTDEEERMIIEGHKKFGNKWAEIAKCIPERSENSIKNHWHATKRKLRTKRRIKRPEMADELVQSTALEEYIMNTRSTTSSAATAPPIDHDSISYFIFESSTNMITEESMNHIVHPLTHVDDDESSLCNDFMMTSENIVDEEMSFMENLFADNENNFSRAGNGNEGDNVPMNEAQDCVDFDPEVYFTGSLDNMD